METSNTVHFSVDMSTETGKQIFAAVAAIYGGIPLGAVPTQPAIKAASPKATPAAPAPSAPVASAPVITAPVVKAPTAAPSAPSAPVAAPPAIKAPSAPALPSAPVAKAPTAPKAPTPVAAPVAAPAAPVVAFEDLDEDGKREAILKITTKHSKKGKTADMKAFFTAYSGTNVATIPAESLDHFYDTIKRYDGGESAQDIFNSWGAAQ